MWPPPPPTGQAYAPPTVYQGAPPPAPGYGYGGYQAPYGAPPAPAYGAPYGAPPAPAYGQYYPPVAGGAAAQQPPAASNQQGSYSAPPPQAAQPAYVPPPMPPAGGPAKKALLIGCAYPGSSAQLNGCINDVKIMKHLLTTRFGFQEQNIVVLKDDQYHPDFFSSRVNISRGIQWLMMGMAPGSSLFFHFSGHGSQKADYSGDEDDGMDETILPTDFKQAGQIVDDELNQLLVRPLLPGVTLHCVIDACHSGTVLDLSYRTKVKKGQGMVWKGRPKQGKGTAGGTCLQFGACRDSQVAQDTNRMSGSVHTGAATYSFIQAIERGGAQQSYSQVLYAMHSALEAAQGGGASASMANAVMGLLLGGMVSTGQTPVLSCDKPLDLNTRLML